MLDANFWQNKAISQKIVKEKKLYEDLIDSYEKSIKKLKDIDELNVLAIHAEVEGIACESMFHDFLKSAKLKGIEFVPLGQLLENQDPVVAQSAIINKEIPGRDGWISWQN